jgi:FlaA1/EpsC-like NDP-sugar epimerase
MRSILAAWKPQTVYHAAAYKHVPLVEHNPAEGLRNNVFGTLTVAQAAIDGGIDDFVLISTDKAVRPTNVMGASKRVAEIVLQALAANQPTTRMSMVRFGNVLGSSGSVVPLFRGQIKAGGPITITHEEVTRYFMTIPEAAQLVIQAGAMAHGGDVFVLDMGEPVKIIDLARKMIDLSGLSERTEANPYGDIDIEIVGLRPGEKLYEELLIGDDPQGTSHPRIMKANDEYLSWPLLERQLGVLQAAIAANDVPAMRAQLVALVSGYKPDSDIVDWIYMEAGQSAQPACTASMVEASIR